MTTLRADIDPLPLISTGAWDGKPAGDRVWLLDEWIPVMRATLLTGDGGSGKSLLAQQLATCVALGLPFMGVKTRQQRSLYVTCEDDRTELHRRQEGICAALGVSMAELDGKLFFLSRCGELDNSLLHFGSDGVIQPSRFYRSIEAVAESNAIMFLALDNIAHLFEGNENIRNHVAIFCNALEMMARSIGGTVLFLGHPAKSGAQFSGSTAWENQVRSRLYLSRPDAATFGSEARIGSIVETIERGAFRTSLGEDILALMDHDPARVLGRTRSGTLRLSEDTRGLSFSLDLPDTQPGRDVLELAQRNDLGGMSFGFVVPRGGDSWKGERRSLRTVTLREISVVSSFPAYPDTSLALRSRPFPAANEARRRRIILAELSA